MRGCSLKRVRILAFLGLVTVALAAAGATAQGTGQAGKPQPCDSNLNYRQFDFWVGEWEVTAGGKKAGTNRIELIENNCIVFENWTGAGGGSGRSFNFYNNQTKKWNQIWVDSVGNNLQFEGEFRAGNLHYTATTLGAGGAKTRHKLTFFNLQPGHVRQLWESSTDGGTTWTVVFDGDYRRKP